MGKQVMKRKKLARKRAYGKRLSAREKEAIAVGKKKKKTPTA
jgi:hypothetical protein